MAEGENEFARKMKNIWILNIKKVPVVSHEGFEDYLN